MGFLKKLFGGDSEKESHVEVVSADGAQEVFGYVTDVPGKGLSLDEAQAVQEQALAATHAASSVDEKINAAAQVLTSGNFQASIAAYEQIARDHPEEAATCEGQIGAAKYFLKDYEGAIVHYEKAKGLGAHAQMMDENIAEAREALA